MKIEILYYSGAGNTKFIGEKIKKHLITKEIKVGITQIKERTNYPSDFDTLILGFPIYDLSYPSLVKKAIETIDGNKKDLVIFCTKALLSSNAIFEIASLAKRNGFKLITTKEFIMPGTDLLGVAAKRGSFFEKFLKFFYTRDMDKKIEEFLDPIYTQFQMCHIYKKWYTPLEKLIPQSIKDSFHQQYTRFIPMFHSIEKNCTSCMKCVKECPRENIIFNKKIEFSIHCDMCLHCLHHCPSNSIQIGDLTNNTVRYTKVDIRT